MAHIDLGNGMRLTVFDPPGKGFNPLTASHAELVRHGFPPRPEDARHLERYRHVMRQLQGKFHYIQPTFRLNSDKFHGPRARRAAAAGTETSSNWSGAVVYAPAGDSFKWIQGDWVVPNVGAPTQNQWYYCASWIGIDGDGSGDVCQAGVECDVYQSGASITRDVYPWWEWYPVSEVQITNLPMDAGDMVTMLLCTGQAAGSTTATVFFSNRTTGASTSFAFSAPSGTALVGNSAEWIVEAPTVGGSQSAIADYGEVFFTVCEAYTNGGVTMYGGDGNNINLSAGGSIVSDGNLITPTVVQCLYAGSAPVA